MKTEAILKVLWELKDGGNRDYFVMFGMDLFRTDDIEWKIKEVEKIVLDGTLVTHDQLKSRSRKQIYVAPRFMIWYLVKKLNPKISLKRLARYYDRKGTNISLGIKRIKNDIKLYDNIREEIERLELALQTKKG